MDLSETDNVSVKISTFTRFEDHEVDSEVGRGHLLEKTHIMSKVL